jgi:hypothetical protein
MAQNHENIALMIEAREAKPDGRRCAFEKARLGGGPAQLDLGEKNDQCFCD